ncbi:structural protein [Cellulophaga phage phi4:1]|uniref:Structural protein n=5 Tax=Lightbulbvirus TaxID=1918522 RepID=A0A0S2MWE9_9CAUD|nr:virion structural protein [Cellulophaga phage phi4:1]YP_008241533.1 virion structural protein [Cellulophaga phage phi17:2]ALO80046.1 structural protein [Cellulophaga phage phi4:1_13]ALO80243.1 structural protein [Cellulophaga phage phi4:1_18]ALO80441.1 structural protein [Cellulophaga phage phi17:2_18]AGO47571.1 structural protein [Cellulophaga phage phi17:2]AGO49450.1 structural protein [Cellulophaga phage phi4:1]
MASCARVFTVDKRFSSFSNKMDILGRPAKQNPFTNEKEALELLGGIKDKQEFIEALENSDLEYLKDEADSLFEDFSKYSVVPIKVLEGTSLKDKPKTNREYIEQVLTEPEGTAVLGSIDFLLALNVNVLNTNEAEVQKVLDTTLDNVLEIGLDLSEHKGKSLSQMRPMLQSIADFMQFSDEQAFNNVVTEFDLLNPVVKAQTKLVKGPVVNDYTFFMETAKDEYSLFEEMGVIKVDNNVYMEVAKQDLEEMYSELHKTLTEEYLNILDLKEAVITKAKTIEREGAVNTETLQKIVLAKMFFNAPLVTSDNMPSTREKLNLYLNPVKNEGYLMTEFIADFNKESIKEKRKGSKKFDRFYKNFEINEKGIELINNDPVSLKLMESYMDDNIKNYLSITDQLETVLYDDIVTRDLKRRYNLEYPKSLPIFDKNYTKVNVDTISSKESLDFIRLADNSVFENTETIGDTNFYSRVESLEAPQLNLDPKDYEHLQNSESKTTFKNFYSKAVEEEIDKELKCN